ncbi:MAG: hypothetical protein JOZ82_07260 [Marmoricola sp.]|nr:hypothetical protein [Marmoricola sp.]
MSRFRRALVAILAALSVLLVGTVTADSAAAARHHHKKHHHKKKHHRHHRKKPAAAVAHPAACPAFPADNWWNRDVSRLSVDSRSGVWLSHMSTGRDLHPDFGGPYGIPVTTVTASHPKVPVSFGYADESDRVPYPFGADTRIEGGRGSGGDMHAIVVDRSTCRLYETWDTTESGGRWHAGSGATWSLRSDALRPDGWTSADAAGLPIYPGLLRYDEVAAGRVTHAIRFTTDQTSSHHLWPARHDAGSTSSWDYPPMGARFRLKASYSLAGYGAQARTVLTAMKTYGLVLADNGSPWFFQGAQDSRWSNALLDELKRVPASAFEAVDTSSLEVGSGSAATR